MPLVLSLFLILVISFLFSWLAKKFHLSAVIGLILAGLILSLPFCKQNIIVGHENIIERLSDIGLFTLMFLAGFEISWSMLVKEEKDAITVTLFTIFTSLILGTVVFILLGFSLEAALIMGVCFGITAEATKARVLIQLKKLKTKLGSLLMGAGIINDIIGVLFLGIIAYIFTKDFSINEIKILGGVLLAFFAGIGVHYTFDRFSKKIKILEKLLLILVVPFFFVNMGMHFGWQSLGIDYKILLIVIVTAAAGQLIGTILTKPITKLRLKQLYLIGWGMNSKGAVELAIAFIALQVGLLPVNLYSALVITALVSTILFQIIIFRMVKRNPTIMD
jgi:Kef-type K+ transport system membrane component KefB